MFNIFNIQKLAKSMITIDEIANILKTDKDALAAFEKSYQDHILSNPTTNSKNLFQVNAKDMADEKAGVQVTNATVNDIVKRIVNELLAQTPSITWDGHNLIHNTPIIDKTTLNHVTKDEIKALPKAVRPSLTGNLMQVSLNPDMPSYKTLLLDWMKYKETNDMNLYHLFRQGLDILDVDDITSAMIGTNPNSMGNWLPQIAEASKTQMLFKIPKTTIIKVPTTLLQLTRMNYMDLNRTTLDIVDEFCQAAFNLDFNKEYFIKTGTYSSKFDFRNAHVHDPKEVREIGEYLLFIHWQALRMAEHSIPSINGKHGPVIYGVSTTNEWVVREFIKDTETNPCIYKGLPLHTEYRAFVDFDTHEVIGMHPYWDPDVMKKKFESNLNDPTMFHDRMAYETHEDIIMKRYNDNKYVVETELGVLVHSVKGLHGQYSIDIMQNGDDFWIIDMALAKDSAFKECITEPLKPVEENWIPELTTL